MWTTRKDHPDLRREQVFHGALTAQRVCAVIVGALRKSHGAKGCAMRLFLTAHSWRSAIDFSVRGAPRRHAGPTPGEGGPARPCVCSAGLDGSGAMRRLLAEHLREFDQVFDAEDMQILGAAFDKAWEAVQASGVAYAEDQVELVRAILAKHIIAAAKDGERDHSRLRDGALLALAQSNLRRPLR
jgi:hypothetical protein